MRPALAAVPETGRLVVALSGGRDSTVLLHLLRFGGVARERLVAAHLDHGMRPGSARDASWVQGLCRSWDVDLVVGRLRTAPTSEVEARAARWGFFDAVRQGVGAVAVLTAHHADDQAETVLHHAARGAGLRGLGGMRPAAGKRIKPLLAVEGAELDAWARAVGLHWREDPSNDDPGFTRNRLRHEVIPALERTVPGAARSLVRLARTARREEAALAQATELILDRLVRQRDGDGVRLDRDGLLALAPPLRARVLRRAVALLGGRLDATGTRIALAFTRRSASGREVHLTGGVVVGRELDAVTVRAPSRGTADAAGAVAMARDDGTAIEVTAGGEGSAEVVLPGGTAHLHWGPSPPGAGPPAWRAALDPARLQGPLRLRPWRPGDRIRLTYGTKKLKKLLLEARLDRERRRGHPVLEDDRGRIVWVPGIRDAVTPDARGSTFHIWIRHEPRP